MVIVNQAMPTKAVPFREIDTGTVFCFKNYWPGCSVCMKCGNDEGTSANTQFVLLGTGGIFDVDDDNRMVYRKEIVIITGGNP